MTLADRLSLTLGIITLWIYCGHLLKNRKFFQEPGSSVYCLMFFKTEKLNCWVQWTVSISRYDLYPQIIIVLRICLKIRVKSVLPHDRKAHGGLGNCTDSTWRSTLSEQLIPSTFELKGFRNSEEAQLCEKNTWSLQYSGWKCCTSPFSPTDRYSKQQSWKTQTFSTATC